MAFAANTPSERVRFDAGEVTGALGDSVTVLPVVVALAALTPASLPHVLLWFGVFQVVWGVVYGLPVSVEPMKALAGLAIAGTISYAELAAAGLAAGVLLVTAGRLRLLARVSRAVGAPVIRGVQLAVALLLAKTGVELGLADPATAAAAAAIALCAAALGYRRASALVVLAAGLGLALLTAGLPAPALPTLAAFPADAALPDPSLGAAEGALAQLAMTVGNAAVATSLLFSDLFDRDVSPDDLATSMGAMCVVSVPFGGLPMCHGSGGLAGKYAFGARTGGANVVLGGLYLLAAVFAGVVVAFPMAVLGVLLVAVALQLGASARETDYLALTAGVGVLGVLVNVGAAFALGAAAHWALRRRAAG